MDDIHDPQKTTTNDFGYTLTFNLVLPTGQHFHLSNTSVKAMCLKLKVMTEFLSVSMYFKIKANIV